VPEAHKGEITSLCVNFKTSETLIKHLKLKFHTLNAFNFIYQVSLASKLHYF